MIVHSEKQLHTSGRVGGTTSFEMRTDTKPTVDEVATAQQRIGYHPAGYGGPWSIKTVEEFTPGTDPVFVTTWTCSGSCD